METYVKNILLFFLFWNILLTNAVHGSIINRIPLDVETSNNQTNDSYVAQSTEQNDDDVLNVVKQLLAGLTQDSLKDTSAQIESKDNPENDFSQNVVVPASQITSAQNTGDSVGATIDPVNEKDSSQSQYNDAATKSTSTSTSTSTPSTALILVQQPEETTSTPGITAPTQNTTITRNTGAYDNGSSADRGCGSAKISAVSQPKLQLNQVTASQILYHLKMRYEQLYSKQEYSDETYEIIQTQKTFLREMLRATSENNKNIVSTTYAAYYSAEYAHTFALCKLRHITERAELHADTWSKCSQIMETFASFNMSYKEIISQVIESNGSEVLQYDNNDDSSPNNLKTNPPDTKILVLIPPTHEIIERQNLPNKGTQKQSDQLERNNSDDEPAVTESKPQERNTKKYTFGQAVKNLTTYIGILHVFIENLEKRAQDKKTADGEQVADTYEEIHQDIYQQTLSYRKYLKQYFASTNIENGTFSGEGDLETVEEETKTLEMTVEKRFLWLKNVHLLQGQLYSSQSPRADTKNIRNADEMKDNPIQLLWYFEENRFYMEHFYQSQIDMPFASYLPYPNFDVKAVSGSKDDADIRFYLN